MSVACSQPGTIGGNMRYLISSIAFFTFAFTVTAGMEGSDICDQRMSRCQFPCAATNTAPPSLACKSVLLKKTAASPTKRLAAIKKTITIIKTSTRIREIKTNQAGT